MKFLPGTSGRVYLYEKTIPKIILTSKGTSLVVVFVNCLCLPLIQVKGAR